MTTTTSTRSLAVVSLHGEGIMNVAKECEFDPITLIIPGDWANLRQAIASVHVLIIDEVNPYEIGRDYLDDLEECLFKTGHYGPWILVLTTNNDHHLDHYSQSHTRVELHRKESLLARLTQIRQCNSFQLDHNGEPLEDSS